MQTHIHLTFQIASWRHALQADILLKSDTPCRHPTYYTHKHSLREPSSTCTHAHKHTHTLNIKTFHYILASYRCSQVSGLQEKSVFMYWLCKKQASCQTWCKHQWSQTTFRCSFHLVQNTRKFEGEYILIILFLTTYIKTDKTNTVFTWCYNDYYFNMFLTYSFW